MSIYIYISFFFSSPLGNLSFGGSPVWPCGSPELIMERPRKRFYPAAAGWGINGSFGKMVIPLLGVLEK